MEVTLGFQRWQSLTKQVRHNFGLAYLLQTGNVNVHNYAVDFFGKMTEQEFTDYKKFHQ